MVCNAIEKLATFKVEEAQSSLNNINLVAQSLFLSPFFSLKQYYSNSNSKQTVQLPSNSA